MLKLQIEQKQQEVTDLSIQVAKLNNQINYLNERHDMLLKSAETKNREFEQLHERLATFNNMSARQDAKIDELSNSLMISRQSLEKITIENQQMKVERQIWKTSEARHVKEAQDLIRERNTANDRIGELQAHLEDQNQKSASQLKKVQDQMEELTRDLRLSRKQLADAIDDNRTLTSKRDAELRESQIKMERLKVDLEKAKGDLALAVNKEENALTRLKELMTKISTLESRSMHFESMPSGTNVDTERPSGILESDLAQLRLELEVAKSELQLAKEQVETFTSISQASEERLAEMNSTYDTYKQDMETKFQEAQNKLEKAEADRASLQEKLSEVSAALTETQEKMDSQIEEFNSAKKLYETQMESLKQNEEQALRSVAGIKADLSRQAKAIKDAQDNYEREVMAHSASLQQLNTLKQGNAALKSERDHAISQHRASEESKAAANQAFENVKSKLEQDIREMEQRVEDLLTQNKLLHSQFEQLSLSKTQFSDTETLGESSDKAVSDLAEVIKFLRREKEIVETKLQISLQESERSRLQLEHLQKSLDENRIILEEERKRNLDASGSERKHKELLEKIEQANLLRESNITLRTQLESSQARIATLESKLVETEAQIDPLNGNRD